MRLERMKSNSFFFKEIEMAVMKIWRDCLGYAEVTAQDDFFELGGDSLLAIRVVNKIREQFEVECPMKVFLEHPTPFDLANHIKDMKEELKQEVINGSQLKSDSCALRIVPMSFQQKRLYITEQLGFGGAKFHLIQRLHLHGDLDQAALTKAIAMLVQKHASLRTSFHSESDKGYFQYIGSEAEIKLERIPFRKRERISEKVFINQIIAQQRCQPFALDEAPLVRAVLAELSPKHHCLVLVFHHIIVDGWSFKIIAHDLASFYSKISYGITPSWKPAIWDYGHYSQEQNDAFTQGTFAKQHEFWMKELQGLPTVTLPYDRPQRPHDKAISQELSFTISPEQTVKLKQLCREKNTTPYVCLLSVFLFVISRWSGENDLVVGTPVANRTSSAQEEIVGFFVNMLLLRVNLTGVQDLEKLVDLVRSRVVDAQSYQDYPFSKLVEEFSGSRNGKKSPLFQLIFSMQEERTSDFSIGDLDVKVEPVDEGEVEYDLTLNMYFHGRCLAGVMHYRGELFDSTTIREVSNMFNLAVNLLVEKDTRSLNDISLLKESAYEKLIENLAPEPRFGEDTKHVFALLAGTLHGNNTKLALSQSSGSWRYTDLLTQSEMVAKQLLHRGVRPGHCVALSASASFESIACILGIMRAGAAYLPCDTKIESSRLLGILNHANPEVIITDNPVESLGDLTFDYRTMYIKELFTRSEAERTLSLPQVYDPDATAYILFTSGSSGVPKGVEVSQRALCEKIKSLKQAYQIESDDRVLQFSSMVFDVSLEEIFTTLLGGACLVLMTKDSWSTMLDFNSSLCENSITVVNLPASFWREWLYDVRFNGSRLSESLRLVVTGSETVQPSSIEDWRAVASENTLLMNAYGLTESVITSLVHTVQVDMDYSEAVPIGLPLAGTSAYVLDDNLQPVASSFQGMLYLGGNLAKGYLNRQDLTQQSFIPNPFSDNSCNKLLRTGDCVKRLSSGEIVHVGRSDRQVKVQGIRIELAEVERILSNISSIQDAAVRWEKSDEGLPSQGYMVAFVSLRSGEKKRTSDELLSIMRQRCSSQWVPKSLIVLDDIPKTQSGKINYRELPSIVVDSHLQSSIPLYKNQTILLSALKEVLRKDRMSLQDNYFSLGGDSILILRAISILNRKGWTLTPNDFFESHSLSELAECLVPFGVEKEGVQYDFFPLTPFHMKQLSRETPSHNNRSLLVQAKGKLDRQALKYALTHLIQTHGGLRCVFDSARGRGQILPFDDSMIQQTFSCHDLTDQPDQDAYILGHAKNLQASFTLDKGIMVRVAHYQGGTEGDRLLILIHSLLADTHSWSILLEELQEAYRRFPEQIVSNPTTINQSYSMYLHQLDQVINSGVESGQVENYFESMTQCETIPRDSFGTNTEASQCVLSIDLVHFDAQELLCVAEKHNIKSASLVTSAAEKALCDWVQGPLVVDVGYHGRSWQDLSFELGRTVGCFTCDIPLYLSPEHADLSLNALQKFDSKLKNNRALALGRERLPAPPSELSSEVWDKIFNPKVSIDFISAPAFYASEMFSVSEFSKLEDRPAESIRSHEINLVCLVKGKDITLECRYSEARHKRETMKKLINNWHVNILNALKKI